MQILPVRLSRFNFIFSIGVLACLLFGIRSGHAGVEVVVKTGDPAPDGNGEFHIPGQSVLNEAGQVAFFAAMQGEDSPGGGTFVWSGGVMTQMVRHGDLEPDGVTEMGGGSSPALNDSGQIAFVEVFGFGPNDGGVYRGSGGALTRIARTGEVVPDGNGKFEFFDTIPSINNGGEVSFFSRLKETAGGELDNRGLFVGSGVAMTQIARTNQAAADGDGTIADFLIQPALNDAGQASFLVHLAGTTGGVDDDEAIYRGSGGALTQIAIKGQAAPDGDGTIIGFESHGSINAGGSVAFVGMLPETEDEHHPGHTVENFGLYTGSGGALTQVLRTGDSATGGPGTFASIDVPTMNDLGDIVFRGSLAGTPGGFADNRVLYIAKGGELTEVARRGDPTPEGTSFHRGFNSQPSITNSGLVAFVGSITDTPGESEDKQGLFVSDGTETIQIIRSGDSFAGSEIDILFFASGDPAVAASRRTINEAGQVVFWSQLADFTTAVGLFTPELSFRSAVSAAWDDEGVWTLGLEPGEVHGVMIDPAVDVTVTGPFVPADVRKLTVGGGSGVGTFSLDGGTIRSTEPVTVTEMGVVTGVGVIDGDLEIDGLGRFEVMVDGSADEGLMADGTATDSAHTTLAVTGSVSLGGVLGVGLAGAVLPEIGDEVVVMSYESRGGTLFDALEGVVLDSGLAMAPLFGEDLLVLRASVPGDLDFNDAVSVADLSTFALNFGTAPGVGSWDLGDFNGDGVVSVADLSLLALNFGFELGASEAFGLGVEDLAVMAGIDLALVPEPGVGMFIVIGLSIGVMRRGRS